MWVSHTAKLIQPHPTTNNTGMLRKEELWNRSTQAPGAHLGPFGQGILSFRVVGTWSGGVVQTLGGHVPGHQWAFHPTGMLCTWPGQKLPLPRSTGNVGASRTHLVHSKCSISGEKEGERWRARDWVRERQRKSERQRDSWASKTRLQSDWRDWQIQSKNMGNDEFSLLWWN